MSFAFSVVMQAHQVTTMTCAQTMPSPCSHQPRQLSAPEASRRPSCSKTTRERSNVRRSIVIQLVCGAAAGLLGLTCADRQNVNAVFQKERTC
jgi:hypothetical protein